MSTSDEDTSTAAAFPDHVIGTGNVAGRQTPDPVVATAPQADAALDDEDAGDRLLATEGAPILPVTGMQTGAVAPPRSPR